MNTAATVRILKEWDEDYNWYPTTPDILEIIKADIQYTYDSKNPCLTVLDCGSGDGRCLMALTSEKKGLQTRYAIEKSMFHRSNMDKSIFIVGTDFWQENLDTKVVDIVFSNPPYSEYEAWAEKIIKTASSTYIYLVMPIKWRENKRIVKALRSRKIIDEDNDSTNVVFQNNDDLHKTDCLGLNQRVKSLGTFDFSHAERVAKVEVEVVRFYLDKFRSTYSQTHRTSKSNHSNKIKAFDLWFDENLKFDESSPSKSTLDGNCENGIKQSDGNSVKVLVENYENDKANMLNVIISLTKLEPTMLSFIGVDSEKLKKSLEARITETTHIYWKKLFQYYKPINTRLCTSQRDALTNTISENGNVQFSESNVLAVTEWAIKNAKGFMDDQLIDMFKK